MTCNFHKVSSNNDIETVAAVIESCLYVCVYISPQTPWANVETFFSDMLQECTQVLKPNHNLLDIIFLGDFNATNHKERLVELFERFGLNQQLLCIKITKLKILTINGVFYWNSCNLL